MSNSPSHPYNIQSHQNREAGLFIRELREDEGDFLMDTRSEGGQSAGQNGGYEGGYEGGDADSDLTDFEPGLSYDQLMAYSQQQEMMFNHPELMDQGVDSPSRRAQLFRPVVALEPFLDSARHSQEHIAKMAAWHLEQYEMYSHYMDREAEEGGNANYLDEVASRLNTFQTTQHLWRADNDEDVYANIPADQQIEQAMLSNETQLKHYERSMLAAYTAVEERSSARTKPQPKKRPAGASTFRHPVRVPIPTPTPTPNTFSNNTNNTYPNAYPNAYSKNTYTNQIPVSASASTSADSQRVMNNLDDILGSSRSPKLNTTSLTPEHNSVFLNSEQRQERENDAESAEYQMEESLSDLALKSKGFLTAHDQLLLQQEKITGTNVSSGGTNVSSGGTNVFSDSYGQSGKILGATGKKYPASKFTIPLPVTSQQGGVASQGGVTSQEEPLKHVDPKMVEAILATVVETTEKNRKTFDDISGLEDVKDALLDLVVYPLLNPELYTGMRSPSKGLLLYGPPGTGKTLIARCVATESQATFFSISASTITSKWIGDGEKMVRALFEVARTRLPAVIFIDEVDSLLSQRSSEEHESSRRLKTEFLTQFDGLSTDSEERLLVIGATNRPQEIDEAARRRFVKRLYIPPPEKAARMDILRKSLGTVKHDLSVEQLFVVGGRTEGFSGADVTNLCKEAAQNGIRELMRSTNKCKERIRGIAPDAVRPVTFEDFEKALLKCSSSLCQSELDLYVKWNEKFGAR